MSTFPWQLITVVSLVCAYFLVTREPEWSKARLVAVFFGTSLVQTVAWIFYRVILWPKFLSPLRSLPEPKGGSFWNGQAKRIAAEPSGMPMRDWVSTIPNDGLMRYLGVFNQERVLVTGSKALSEILVTQNYNFAKPYSFRYNIGRILGVGVLLAEGDEHKVQRKNLMPAFAFRHVKDLYPTFWQKGREVVQAMTKEIVSNPSNGDGPRDLEKPQNSAVLEVDWWASRVTLDIIGVSGLGRDFGAIQDPDNELNRTYRNLFKPSRTARMLSFLAIVFPEVVLNLLPVKRNNDIAAAAKYIRRVCMDLIQEKKQKMARKEPTDYDILSVALESGGFSDVELVDQLMTFLAAGHETTASAMTWAVYMLSRYPEVQRKLRQEIREKLPSIDSEREVSSVDIDHMPYLNAVCNEVLRYYSPVPLTFREAVKETTVLGQKIPRGTRVVLCANATNLDPNLWGPDAHEFQPDRWLPKGPDDKKAASGNAASNFAFMSFLHGPRSCIGQSFAKAEFASLLATWVGRFEFSLKNEEEMDEKNMEIKGGITARPAKGLYVHATIVDGW
ncbi:cytochrome P450 [Xylariomycetidae sp. FL2044]|nr:cytochrome P450 [Xylariomycetidae sp. FL2044]